MAECAKCGEQTSMPFTCKFCEQSFCSIHRLPENHDCTGLEAYKEQSQDEGKIGYDVVKNDTTDDAPADTRRIPVEASNSGWMPDLASALPINMNATYAVLGLLFGVFLLEGTVQGFFQSFALVPELALTEPWRLFTSMFLHANLGHLLVNSIVLFSFGTQIEQMLGTKRFLTVLLVAGLASSVGFAISGFMFGMGPAVGLSGGLYGLVTMLAVLRPDVRVLALFIIPLKIRTAVAFFAAMDTVNFLAHSLGIMLPIIGGFASAGHLSGLLAGLYFGYRWKGRYQPPQTFWGLGPSRTIRRI